MPVWGWILIGCSGCGCLLIPIFAAIMFPVFAQARLRARMTSCLSNQKQIALGNLMYAQDYDERFPIASEWQSGIDTYIKNDKVFHCPEVAVGTDPSRPVGTTYAFNRTLGSISASRIAAPKDTILTFETTDFSRNANDALTSLPSPGRHRSGNNLSFADGHAQFWRDAEPLPTGKILPDSP
jgi:prepilin-type processing-associated H-X9-DG protein